MVQRVCSCEDHNASYGHNTDNHQNEIEKPACAGFFVFQHREPNAYWLTNSFNTNGRMPPFL